ncbi:MAG: Ku protein [Pseudomonadota bacterium]
MQRSLWKGAISFGLVHIPVQMFSASDQKDLDLTMVDKRDFAPIGYKRINKETGKEVEWDNIVKAYEYEADTYVVLSPEDLKRANVKATQTIDILAFVDAAEVPLIYYEQPYFLAPGKGGAKVYALLRETLSRSGKIGIAQVVIRTKQHLVALIPMEDMIVLNTLRYPDEIRASGELDLPHGDLKKAGISNKEVDMAMALVKGMTEKWNPQQYHDTYREDVLALVKKKIKAKQTRTITAPEPEKAEPKSAKIIDLMALLRQSVSEKGERGASKDEPAKKSRPRSVAAASKAPKKPAAPRRARA